MLIPSSRASHYDDTRGGCHACGGPRARWVVSLARVLCAECERASTHHPEREPVLVGKVLADAADALAHTTPTTTPAHPYSAVLLALWRAKAQRGT
ncbi:hypothetical protein [Streptomyces sp. NPDC058401]|uniref:hypothetical protein n=1 Tax=Streptomyces sp. NPDC058401 TaxID=3346480 RepID=UPI0036649C5A